MAEKPQPVSPPEIGAPLAPAQLPVTPGRHAPPQPSPAGDAATQVKAVNKTVNDDQTQRPVTRENANSSSHNQPDPKSSRPETKPEEARPGEGRLPQHQPGPPASGTPSTHPEGASVPGVPMPHAEPPVGGQTSSLVAPTASAAGRDVSPQVPSAAPAKGPQSASPGDTASHPPAASGDVQAARIVDRASQAEMHIGLRSSTFGTVEVHTVVRESQVGVTVGSDKGDLRAFLGPEIPALQSSLGQHELRFDSVRFLATPANLNSGFSSFADSQSRPGPQDRPTPVPTHRTEVRESPAKAEQSAAPLPGLNVHA
ncbi:MAG TPA: hypothetical protein VMH85_05260 [Terriglobales bacterium]|nr:hypothetical protein [Terriglobales bacterium]